MRGSMVIFIKFEMLWMKIFWHVLRDDPCSYQTSYYVTGVGESRQADDWISQRGVITDVWRIVTSKLCPPDFSGVSDLFFYHINNRYFELSFDFYNIQLYTTKLPVISLRLTRILACLWYIPTKSNPIRSISVTFATVGINWPCVWWMVKNTSIYICIG